MANLVGHLDAVQDHVGGSKQVRQRLLLDAVDGVLQCLFISGRFDVVLALVINGAGQEAARAAGRVHDGFFQLRIDAVDHKTGDGTRGKDNAIFSVLKKCYMVIWRGLWGSNTFGSVSSLNLRIAIRKYPRVLRQMRSWRPQNLISTAMLYLVVTLSHASG